MNVLALSTFTRHGTSQGIRSLSFDLPLVFLLGSNGVPTRSDPDLEAWWPTSDGWSSPSITRPIDNILTAGTSCSHRSSFRQTSLLLAGLDHPMSSLDLEEVVLSTPRALSALCDRVLSPPSRKRSQTCCHRFHCSSNWLS